MYMIYINIEYIYCVPVSNDRYIFLQMRDCAECIYSLCNEVSDNGVAASQH